MKKLNIAITVSATLAAGVFVYLNYFSFDAYLRKIKKCGNKENVIRKFGSATWVIKHNHLMDVYWYGNNDVGVAVEYDDHNMIKHLYKVNRYVNDAGYWDVKGNFEKPLD